MAFEFYGIQSPRNQGCPSYDLFISDTPTGRAIELRVAPGEDISKAQIRRALGALMHYFAGEGPIT